MGENRAGESCRFKFDRHFMKSNRMQNPPDWPEPGLSRRKTLGGITPTRKAQIKQKIARHLWMCWTVTILFAGCNPSTPYYSNYFSDRFKDSGLNEVFRNIENA